MGRLIELQLKGLVGDRRGIAWHRRFAMIGNRQLATIMPLIGMLSAVLGCDRTKPNDGEPFVISLEATSTGTIDGVLVTVVESRSSNDPQAKLISRAHVVFEPGHGQSYSMGPYTFHGPYVEWYEHGVKSAEGEYRDDKKVGVWKYWDAGGKVIRTESHE